MSGIDRKKLAARLASPGMPDKGLAEAIGALKPAERYELVVQVLNVAKTGSEAGEPLAMQHVLPQLIGDDYVRGLKADVASKRLAAITRAAKRLDGVRLEGAAIAALIARVSESTTPQLDPELIVSAARIERPSVRAVAAAVLDSGEAGFAKLAAWARLAAISSATITSADEAVLAAAIDQLIGRLGTATNVVPPEIVVLRRSLQRGAEEAARRETAPEPPVRSAPFEATEALNAIAGHIRSLEQRQKHAEEEAAAARIEKARADQSVTRLEAAQRELDSTVRKLNEELSLRGKELLEAQKKAEEAQGNAQRLESKLHDTESLLSGATGVASRAATRRLREQCGGPLDELGEYVNMIAAGNTTDVGRLVRSYERLEKTFRRVTTVAADSDEGAVQE